MSWHPIPRALAIGLIAVGLVGCSSPAPESEEGSEPASEEEAAPAEEASPESDAPRVFFANLEDGGTYASPVSAEFGVDNYEIGAVVEGENPEGVGHFHLAVDTECVPQGEIIPEGQGYIHFGDGSNTIDVQLEPGEHTLCLQIGDGEHRVPAGDELAGLTHEITVNVEE